uniref:Aminoacyl-tRNA hydrolase n=1 Tax=Angiostrongylus cantonensis TaxID=6313 RepID=A0A158PAG0_ANGCA
MTFSFETSRIAEQILSDDVDCSLLMKEATLERFNIQRQMLFGVMCLALLVPYSVTPHSSISTMLYYMQKREALANSFRLGHITEECAVSMPPSTCKLRSQYKYMQGYIDLVGGLKNSSLNNVWKIGATKREKAKDWLFQGGNLNDTELPLRKFRIPKALENAMMLYNVSSQYTHIVGSKIVISENVTEKLLNDFLPVKSDTPNLTAALHKIMLRNNLERGYMDAGFHALLLHAHHYAERLIAEQQDATALDESTKSRSYETILMINLGMNATNDVPKLLSSAAGLMIIDKGANNAPIIVASASGSLRTVEAVASVILRMLIFDEEPGAAIHANASFYDTEDPGFYCENNDEKFLKEMEKKGISCFPLKQDKFAHMDRIAMAIRQRLPKGRLIAAVDRRAQDFNYAVGL